MRTTRASAAATAAAMEWKNDGLSPRTMSKWSALLASGDTGLSVTTTVVPPWSLA